MPAHGRTSMQERLGGVAPMLVAIIGPETGSYASFRKAFQLLGNPDSAPLLFRTSGLEAVVPWVALSLDATTLSGPYGPVSEETRAVDALQGLIGVLPELAGLGFLVAYGTDDGLRGSFGVALEEARRFEKYLKAGEVVLCPSMVTLLAEEAGSVAPLLPAGGAGGVSLAETQAAQKCGRWVPALQRLRRQELPTSRHGSLQAVACGDVSLLLGLDVSLEVIRNSLGIAAAVTPPFEPPAHPEGGPTGTPGASSRSGSASGASAAAFGPQLEVNWNAADKPGSSAGLALPAFRGDMVAVRLESRREGALETLEGSHPRSGAPAATSDALAGASAGSLGGTSGEASAESPEEALAGTSGEAPGESPAEGVVSALPPEGVTAWLIRHPLEARAPVMGTDVRVSHPSGPATDVLVLDERKGKEQLLLLFCVGDMPLELLKLPEVPVPRLGAGLGPDPQGMMYQLAHRLRDRLGFQRFMLIQGPLLETGGIPLNLPPCLQDVMSALELQGPRNALELLQPFLQDPTVRCRLSLREALERDLLQGICQRRLGDPAGARITLKPVLEQALAAGFRTLEGKVRREYGRVLLDLGEAGQAQHELETAVRLWEELQVPLEAARARLQLAWLHRCMDRFELSAAVSRLILRPARQARDSALLLAAQRQLGQVCHDLGQVDEARQAYTEVLKASEQQKSLSDQMKVHGDLGLLELDFGSAHKAVEHLLEQRQLVRRLGNTQWEGLACLNLGRAYLRLKRLPLAIPLLHEATALLDPNNDNLLLARVVLAEAQLLNVQPEEGLETLERCPPSSMVGNTEFTWRYARIKGLLLDAVGDIQGARQVLAGGIQRVDDWQGSLSEPARPLALDVASQLYEALLGVLLRQGASAEMLVGVLEHACARSLDAPEVLPSPPNAVRLPGGYQGEESGDPGAAMLREPFSFQSATLRVRELVRGLSRLPGQPLTALYLYSLPDELLVVRMGGGDTVAVTVPVSREWLDTRLEKLGRLCIQSRKGDEPAIEALLQGLSEAVLKPLLPLLATARHLALVLQGALHRLPWHALPLPEGHALAGQPLGMVLDVSYPSSIRLLMRPRLADEYALRRALLLGDVQRDLVYTRKVMPQLEAFLTAAGVKVERFEGNAATPMRLLQQAQDAGLVQISVHGILDPDGVARSLALSDGKGGVVPLTAAELMRGSLEAAVVLLTACASGAGPLSRSGEGPWLLSRACLRAGARSVISSAWPIPDLGTAQVLYRLYPSLLAGQSVVRALAQVQRSVWQEHPSLAAFCLSAGALKVEGDGTTHVSLPV